MAFGLWFLALTCPAHAGQVTLAWDANTEIELGGYKLYLGQASRTYTASVEVGNNTIYSVDGLEAGQTYYFAVTAYDSFGQNESEPSNEVQATIPFPVTPMAASFSASPTTGTAPLSVAFTDSSSGSITNWSWNFGDGVTVVGNNIAAQHPNHTYSAPGTYSVTLTVTGDGASNTATKTNYVSASPPPPVAGFKPKQKYGTAPLNVAFTDTSTGNITSWSWNFGDGTTSALQHPSHTYSVPGTYTVSLKVTGPGGSHTALKTPFVAVAAPAPTAKSKRTHEDAQDGNISGWSIYDNTPGGATISNVYDNDRNGRVIQLTGSGIQNGYQLRAPLITAF